jgi:hypothetical protein
VRDALTVVLGKVSVDLMRGGGRARGIAEEDVKGSGEGKSERERRRRKGR